MTTGYVPHSIMNWTGGRLQQHKDKGGNSAAKRQKQHFANVRQRLQNGGSSPQRAPFRPNFLARDPTGSGTTAVNSFALGLRRHFSHSKVQQRKLEDFRSTAPLARRLASIKERSSSSSKTNVKPNGDHKKGAVRVIRASPHQNSQTPHAPKRRARSPARSSASSHKRFKIQASVEEDTLEIRRRKLLEQSDWVGLAPSRPLHMKFPSLRDKDKIGKRRKMDRSIRERREHFPMGNNKMNKEFAPDGLFMSGALGGLPESISVRIGDDALASQMSAAPQAAREWKTVPTIQHERSDTMLPEIDQQQVVAHDNPKLTEPTVELENPSLPTALLDLGHEQEFHHLRVETLYGDTASQHHRNWSEGSVHRLQGGLEHGVNTSATSHSPDLLRSRRFPREENHLAVGVLVDHRGSNHPSSPLNLQAVEVASEKSTDNFYPTTAQPLRLVFNSTSLAESSRDHPLDTTVVRPTSRPLQTEEASHQTAQLRRPTTGATGALGCTIEERSLGKTESAWMKFLATSTSLPGSSGAGSVSDVQPYTNEIRDHIPDDQISIVVDETLRTRSSIAPLPKDSTAANEEQSAELQDEMGPSREELWRKFVFADDDVESTLSDPAGEDDNERPTTELVGRPLASSLVVGVSTSSLSINANKHLANATMKSYQSGNSSRAPALDSPTSWDEESDHDLNEASLQNNPANSDALPHFRPDADPRSWAETTSLARASMLQNLSGSSSLSTDATGAAGANHSGGQLDSIRRTLFTKSQNSIEEANAARNGPLWSEAPAGEDERGKCIDGRQKSLLQSIYDFPVDDHEMLEDIED